MEESVREELEQVALVVAQPIPILYDVLRVNPDNLSQVRKVVVTYHPYACGDIGDPRPSLGKEDCWGAVETARHYTETLGRPLHAYDVLCYYDRTVAIKGDRPHTFPDHQQYLRSLLWAFAGQPGHLDSGGFFDCLDFFLSPSAREELSFHGRVGVAGLLTGLLRSLRAEVVFRDVKTEPWWGGTGQFELTHEPPTAPVEGAFWRRVFGAFRDAFVLNPPTDLRLGHRDLRETTRASRARLHLPRHPVPQPRGNLAVRLEQAVKKTAELLNSGLTPSQVASQMDVSERTVYYRRKTARERGLLAP